MEGVLAVDQESEVPCANEDGPAMAPAVVLPQLGREDSGQMANGYGAWFRSHGLASSVSHCAAARTQVARHTEWPSSMKVASHCCATGKDLHGRCVAGFDGHEPSAASGDAAGEGQAEARPAAVIIMI